MGTEIEPGPLPVRLVQRGSLLVAVPVEAVPPLTPEMVEQTRQMLQNERARQATEPG